MGLAKNAFFLGINDLCKGNNGIKLLSNTKIYWLWNKQKINCGFNLWRFERSHRTLSCINGRGG